MTGSPLSQVLIYFSNLSSYNSHYLYFISFYWYIWYWPYFERAFSSLDGTWVNKRLIDWVLTLKRRPWTACDSHALSKVISDAPVRFFWRGRGGGGKGGGKRGRGKPVDLVYASCVAAAIWLLCYKNKASRRDFAVHCRIFPASRIVGYIHIYRFKSSNPPSRTPTEVKW